MLLILFAKRPFFKNVAKYRKFFYQKCLWNEIFKIFYNTKWKFFEKFWRYFVLWKTVWTSCFGSLQGKVEGEKKCGVVVTGEESLLFFSAFRINIFLLPNRYCNAVRTWSEIWNKSHVMDCLFYRRLIFLLAFSYPTLVGFLFLCK